MQHISLEFVALLCSKIVAASGTQSTKLLSGSPSFIHLPLIHPHGFPLRPSAPFAPPSQAATPLILRALTPQASPPTTMQKRAPQTPQMPALRSSLPAARGDLCRARPRGAVPPRVAALPAGLGTWARWREGWRRVLSLAVVRVVLCETGCEAMGEVQTRVCTCPVATCPPAHHLPAL